MMDIFLTWTSSYTPTNPHLSTENQHTPTSMSATIPVTLLLQRQCHQIPYKTSSHPMLLQHLQKELGTVYTTSLQNGHPPGRVKRIMDSVKQKLDNPNKLTLKQFNRQLKATTPSLTASFPFHPTITKKIKKSLASHDVKVTGSSGTTLRDLLTKTKTTLPPHLTPNVIYEISCNYCTAT